MRRSSVRRPVACRLLLIVALAGSAGCGSGPSVSPARSTTTSPALPPPLTVVAATAYPTVPDGSAVPGDGAGVTAAGSDDALFVNLERSGPLSSEGWVGVAVARATPDRPLTLLHCRASTAPVVGEDCITLADGTADGSGGWIVDVPVRRFVELPTADVVDCAGRVGRCVVVAAEIDVQGRVGPRRGSVALTFDAGSPADPAPVLVLDGTAALADGGVVAVATAGFRESEIELAVCEQGGPACAPVWPAEPVLTGGIVIVGLPRMVPKAGGGSIDCATALGTCELRGVGLLGDDLRTSPIPLVFDPATPIRPPVELTVDPTVRLVDGGVIDVRVTGYRAGEQVERPLLCALAVGGDGCDLPGPPSLTFADADGTVEVRLVADRTVETANGPATCGERICAVRAQGGADEPAGLLVPVTFAG